MIVLPRGKPTCSIRSELYHSMEAGCPSAMKPSSNLAHTLRICIYHDASRPFTWTPSHMVLVISFFRIQCFTHKQDSSMAAFPRGVGLVFWSWILPQSMLQPPPGALARTQWTINPPHNYRLIPSQLHKWLVLFAPWEFAPQDRTTGM